MFNSATLDVVIGLVLLYSLLAILASTINEFLASLAEWRSKNLEIGLRNLLDGNDAAGAALLDRFYEHPLIRGLHTRRFFAPGGPNSSKKPSYIPARLFVSALEDILLPTDRQAGPQTLQDLRASASALPPGDTRDALIALLDGAGGDLKKGREAIEHWFDDAMDRLSGWYKRQVQVIIFVISLATAFALNADTLTITNTLIHNPEIRAFVVARAEQVAVQTPGPNGETPEASFKEVQTALEDVGSLQLPLGWKNGWEDLRAVLPWTDLQAFVLKLVGILVTAVAMSFGSQFWFDLLNRLVGLRGAIKPKKADEATSP